MLNFLKPDVYLNTIYKQFNSIAVKRNIQDIHFVYIERVSCFKIQQWKHVICKLVRLVKNTVF
jgi:hypothetical protein